MVEIDEKEFESEYLKELEKYKREQNKEKNNRKKKPLEYKVRYYYKDGKINYVDFKLSYDGRFKKEVPKIVVRFSNGNQRTIILDSLLDYNKIYGMRFWLSYRVEKGRLKSIKLGSNLDIKWSDCPLKFTTFFRTRKEIEEDEELLSMIETSLFFWLFLYHEWELKRYIWGKEVYLFSKFSHRKFHPYMHLKISSFGTKINKTLLNQLIKTYRTELVIKSIENSNKKFGKLNFDIDKRIDEVIEKINSFLKYEYKDYISDKVKFNVMRKTYLKNNPFKTYKKEDIDKFTKTILMIDYGYDIIIS